VVTGNNRDTPMTLKVPLRLLRTVGCDEALAGDLVEEAAAGRTLFWIWRECAAAVVQHVIGSLRIRRRLAIESVIVGWALLYLVSLITHQFITAPLVLQLFAGTGLGPWGIAFANAPDLIIPPIAASFLLARLHPHGSFAMTCAFIASFLVLHAGTVGWLLAIDPSHLNSWINLLNVPFTFALMVSGGVMGARTPEQRSHVRIYNEVE